MARIPVPVGALFLLFLYGCGSGPLDIDKAPHSAPESATMTQIQEAIHEAGADLGWGMKPMGAGRMEGRLVLRNHVAVVDIEFDRETFSISYRDSINLDYDGTTIHGNYNGWIANLRNAIVARVSGL